MFLYDIRLKNGTKIEAISYFDPDISPEGFLRFGKTYINPTEIAYYKVSNLEKEKENGSQQH